METNADTSSVQAPYDVAGTDAPESSPTSKPADGGDDGLNQGRSALADAETLRLQADEDGGSGEKDEAVNASEQETKPKEETTDFLTKLNNTQTPEEAAKMLKDAGVDYAAYEQEFITTGGLSEESFNALAKAGIPRTYVENYLKGQQMILSNLVSEIQGIAGGAEEYAKLSQWVAQNMPQEDVTAFNQLLGTGNIPLIKIAVSGLVSSYNQANGVEPELFKGKAASSSAPAQGRFASAAEMIEAMRDPRYGKDPAYTREVERKAAHATFF